MIARKQVTMPAKKSAGEELKQAFTAWIIIVFAYYLITLVVKAVLAPFKLLFDSDKEKLERTLNNVRTRKEARRIRGANAVRDQMLYEYVQRFKVNTNAYKNDPKNDQYKDWYEAWKSGTLLDSELMYAPDIWIKDYEKNNYMNAEFLDYLEKQLDMHLHTGSDKRHLFLTTIKNYFPEFTAKLSLISGEIGSWRDKSLAKNLKMELIDSIIAKGVTKEVAIFIVNSTDDPDTVKKAIVVARRCSELDYVAAMAIYCIKNNYDPDSDAGETINLILNTTGNEDLATAVLNGEVTAEDIVTMFEYANKLYIEDGVMGHEWNGCLDSQFRKLMTDKVKS
jgi:hypothetical protein